MTRSLRIVNTSNWDNEDYELTIGDQPAKTIKPGQTEYISRFDDDGQLTVVIKAVARDGRAT